MCDHEHQHRGAFAARVLRNDRLCDEHYRLRLAVAGLPPTRPGQFVQLQCRPVGEQVCAHEVDWPAGQAPRLTQAELTDREPMLRRPFSLAGRRDTPQGCELEIIYRTVGVGTHWLSGVKGGVEMNLLGPLGNGFAVRTGKPRAALIGGGVGIPPMMYLARAIQQSGISAVAFCGARSARLLPLTLGGEPASPAGHPTFCTEPFNDAGIPAVLASDDGSAGFGGMVTEAFRNWLNANVDNPADLVVYSCGPEPMMRAAAEICLARGIECQLALERKMACGMGTCQSCVVKVRDDNPQGWKYKLCCADGPVFDAASLLW